MRLWLRTLRVDQWVKNVFLFVPIFFSGRVPTAEDLYRLGLGFLCFSLVASCVYIINDLQDLQSDRAHPVKRNRPLAAGTVRVGAAKIMAIGCLLLGIAISWGLGHVTTTLLCAYFALNVAYSSRLKHWAIVDINCIAIGFLLRVFMGGQLAQVEVSHWLGIMTYLLAMFLALAKRRDDLVVKERSGALVRRAMDGYNAEFVNAAMVVFAAVLVVGYSTYVSSAEVMARYGSAFLFLSVIPVVTGLLRYLQLTLVLERTGSPTKLLLSDAFLQTVIAIWLGLIVVFIY
jgi:decaprenyl-phosphate phosphoribosyltransferase